MIPARRALVKPIILPWDKVLKRWKKKGYKKNSHEFSAYILIRKGEMVRSKTEKMLADLFFELGIEYKYECPIYIDERRAIYPDFTFLHPRYRIEIYWEHFGLMDKAEYAEKFVEKMKLYEGLGIFPGQRLIISFETSKKPLSELEARLLINEFLL